MYQMPLLVLTDWIKILGRWCLQFVYASNRNWDLVEILRRLIPAIKMSTIFFKK